MAQGQYTTSQRKFQHLTREKRAQIEILLCQGLPKVQIARAVGISRSTLYNELSRGTVEQIDTNLKKHQRYFWDAGQRVYEENRKNSRPPMKIMKAYDFVRHAEKQILENKMSPDALGGGAKRSGRFKDKDSLQLYRPTHIEGQEHRFTVESEEKDPHRQTQAK